MNSKSIAQLIEACDGSPKSIQETANRILMEEIEFAVGDTVAVVDDESSSNGGMIGQARVKSFSEDKQYANCEFPDGRVVPVLSNQLYHVGT
jgi:hypothetical protein